MLRLIPYPHIDTGVAARTKAVNKEPDLNHWSSSHVVEALVIIVALQKASHED